MDAPALRKPAPPAARSRVRYVALIVVVLGGCGERDRDTAPHQDAAAGRKDAAASRCTSPPPANTGYYTGCEGAVACEPPWTCQATRDDGKRCTHLCSEGCPISCSEHCGVYSATCVEGVCARLSGCI